MNKNTIMAIVIVVLLGASGYIIFTQVFTGGSTDEAVLMAEPTAAVLPYGARLDFTTLKQYHSDSQQFFYPEVAPNNIGVAIPNLIKSEQPVR